MFKTLVLQTSHNLSDERTEYLIRDRLSFMRFLGLDLADTVPDANTIWTFREALTRAQLAGKPAIEALFERFDGALFCVRRSHETLYVVEEITHHGTGDQRRGHRRTTARLPLA